VFVLAAFGIGYLMGAGKDHLQDVGGLGTAQRNTAAGMIIAVQNFSGYPDVLVMLTLANTLGILMLMFIARRLSRDNKVETETV
jgi:bile acid:Na+ symporter, BASS family